MLPSTQNAATPCPDCDSLQRQPMQAQPHPALRRFTTVPARRSGGVSSAARAVYRCRVCSAWLSRPARPQPAATAWRLEACTAG